MKFQKRSRQRSQRRWPLEMNEQPPPISAAAPRIVSDTSEKGLEALIVGSLGDDSGYVQSEPEDYDRDHAVDVVQLFNFLQATQPKTVELLGIGEDGPK